MFFRRISSIASNCQNSPARERNVLNQSVFGRLMIEFISLTPSFSWVWKGHPRENRFNGLPSTVEIVETAYVFSGFERKVAQSCTLPYRRFSICAVSDKSHGFVCSHV